MCDYSLHHVATRPARIEDKLVATKFRYSIVTRGFAASKNADLLKISRAPRAQQSQSMRGRGDHTRRGILKSPASSQSYQHS